MAKTVKEVRQVEMRVRLTFVSDILGTACNNPQVYEEFIYKKDPLTESSLADEIETLGADDYIEKSMTVFHKDEQGPFLYGYMFKGFLKESIKHMRNAGIPVATAVTCYKEKMNGNIQIVPDKIRFKNLDGIGVLQRSLRASTPQGERVALACSEQINEGNAVSFLLRLESDALEPVVRAALDHGLTVGIGQWRGSGCKGRFYWEEVNEKGEVIYSNKKKYLADKNLKIDW